MSTQAGLPARLILLATIFVVFLIFWSFSSSDSSKPNDDKKNQEKEDQEHNERPHDEKPIYQQKDQEDGNNNNNNGLAPPPPNSVSSSLIDKIRGATQPPVDYVSFGTPKPRKRRKRPAGSKSQRIEARKAAEWGREQKKFSAELFRATDPVPEWHDEVYNVTSPPEKPFPPFFVRPAKRGADVKIKWKCSPRKIGPFHVDAPTTLWPTCRMLDHDSEGRTFAYLAERVMCGLPAFFSSSSSSNSDSSKQSNNNNNNNDDDAAGGGGGESSSNSNLPSHRPLRVVQVGANTGGNLNDPLVRLLHGAYAQAVLMEPVPWIFHKLHETYANLPGMITLVQAAMSNKDAPVSFVAPRASMMGKGPWLHQMGGMSLPKRSFDRLKRMKLTNQFAPITVAAFTLQTVLQKFAPWVNRSDYGLPEPPDAFVVDAEGFDGVIVHQVLDYVQLLDDAGRSDETVAIIQYENKHIPRADNKRLMERLTKMGYSVTEVWIDTVAVRTGRAFGIDVKDIEKRWPPCDQGFSVERR